MKSTAYRHQQPRRNASSGGLKNSCSFSLASGRGGEQGAGRSFGEMAILYRLSRQADELENALQRRGIPFQLVGATPYFLSPAAQAVTGLSGEPPGTGKLPTGWHSCATSRESEKQLWSGWTRNSPSPAIFSLWQGQSGSRPRRSR